MTTVSCVIDATGIYAPTYPEVLSYLQTKYQEIFGIDSYINPDSMDGQLLAIFALAVHDSNNSTINTFNSYSPTYGQGVGLSNMVKLNGISRLVPTNSTANVTIIGVAGTIINNGLVKDADNNTWTLPVLITIPIGGEISVLATCATLGDILAPINTITSIQTPTLGWQTVTNPAISTVGQVVESDSILRTRQEISVAYPALAVTQAVLAAVSNVVGVSKVKLYENFTNATDSNTLPPHSICIVAIGASDLEIANAIGSRKTAGTGTYGTTSIPISLGNTVTVIDFYRPTIKTLQLTINITALTGYTSLIGIDIKDKLVSYISGLDIGEPLYYTTLIQQAVGTTYHLTSLTAGIDMGAQDTTDKIILFNELITLDILDISLVVV